MDSFTNEDEVGIGHSVLGQIVRTRYIVAIAGA